MSKVRSGSREHEIPSGSPKSGEPVYLVVGRLRRTHGVKGEILFDMSTDFPESVSPGKQVFVGSKKTPLTIATIRQTDKLWLLSFEGFENCESVGVFRNQWLYRETSQLKALPKGRFYHHEVIGMLVKDDLDRKLGEVSEILMTGANDVYVVKTAEGGEILIPAVKSVIQSMDRESRTIIVHPQEWT